MSTSFEGKNLRGYQLRELIGRGGFGVVYTAREEYVEREVAIKIILPEYASKPDFIRRFETEAQLVARLEHPHIVPLYNYWRDQDGAYLVMRLLTGGGLDDKVLRGGLPAEYVARVLDQIGGALSAAHRRGVIHQDLKPGNILLDTDDNFYLSDFGIAKEVSKDRVGEVDNAPRHGTLRYAAPEVLAFDPVSFQADIYSLGIMTFELLAGVPPFQGKTLDELVMQHLNENVPPLQKFRPDLPREINQVIATATAKNPKVRYLDALKMAEEFRTAIQSGYATKTNPIPSPTGRAEAIQPRKSVNTINPYKGLRAFSESDAQDFFGREAFVERLIRRLNDRGAAASFLAVAGASGTGKSSVIKAGLLPALAKGALPGSDNWFISSMIPGATPLNNLEQALRGKALNARADLGEMLRNPDGYGLFRALEEQVLPDDGGQTQFVLYIDQFEELFTLTRDEAQRAFLLDMLYKTITSSGNRLWCIISLRADFIDRPLNYEGFGELLRDRLELIMPMTSAELVQAITRPAERADLVVEPELIPLILEDVSKHTGALPLMQYALSELFANRKGDALSVEVYQKLGRVSGALSRRADELYALSSKANQEVIRQIFIRLVTISENAEPTRRRARLRELGAAVGDQARIEQVLNSFGKYRLFTFDYDSVTNEPTIEIAHEALIREWGLARAWVEENRALLEAHRSLITEAREWDRNARDESFLAKGARLTLFEELSASPILTLEPVEQEFLAASLALRAREEQERQQRLRRVQIAAGVFAALALVAAGVALFAFTQFSRANAETERANEQAQVARSRQLAITALTNTDQPDVALLLSLESLRAADTFEARSSLLSGLQTRPQLLSLLHTPSDSVRALAFSSDGLRLVAASLDNTLSLWDMSTNTLIARLEGHNGRVTSVAFSPDGALIASGSADETVRLWDGATGGEIAVLQAHTDGINAVAFSSDGAILASGGDDNVIILWDTTSREPITQLVGHNSSITALVFRPQSETLTLASGDLGGEGGASIRLWRLDAVLQGGQPESAELTGHTGAITALAFSPNGRLLASASGDNTVRVWSPDAGSAIGQPRTGHTSGVRALAFAPRDPLLASGDGDGVILVWNTALPDQAPDRLPGVGAGEIRALTFSPGVEAGRTLLASGGVGGQIALWDVLRRQPLATPLTGQPGLDVAYAITSPDGGRIASAALSTTGGSSAATNVWLWDRASGTQTTLLDSTAEVVTALAYNGETVIAATTTVATAGEHQLYVWGDGDQQILPVDLSIVSAVFSEDGRTLATGTAGGQIALWSVENGALTRLEPLLSGHEGQVLALAFSPDGTRLASAGQDETVRLWDVNGRSAISSPLTGHAGEVLAIAYSPDGRWIASGGADQTVRLWDAAAGQPFGEPLEGHRAPVLALAFNPVNTMLASGGRDNTILLWDVTPSARRLWSSPLVAHRDWVTALDFSRDGSLMISASGDETVLQWDMSLESWGRRACVLANRSFTPDEWTRFLPDAPYHATCEE